MFYVSIAWHRQVLHERGIRARGRMDLDGDI